MNDVPSRRSGNGVPLTKSLSLPVCPAPLAPFWFLLQPNGGDEDERQERSAGKQGDLHRRF